MTDHKAINIWIQSQFRSTIHPLQGEENHNFFQLWKNLYWLPDQQLRCSRDSSGLLKHLSGEHQPSWESLGCFFCASFSSPGRVSPELAMTPCLCRAFLHAVVKLLGELPQSSLQQLHHPFHCLKGSWYSRCKYWKKLQYMALQLWERSLVWVFFCFFFAFLSCARSSSNISPALSVGCSISTTTLEVLFHVPSSLYVTDTICCSSTEHFSPRLTWSMHLSSIILNGICLDILSKSVC